jgi:hypothetical protein
MLHTVVLHRIVARDGARFVVRGDNNSWLDPEHPRTAQIVGRLWVHVPHGGTALLWMHRPIVAGPAAAAVFALLTSTTRRRRHRPRPGGDMMSRPLIPGAAVAALAAVTIAAGAGTAWAFAEPARVPTTGHLPIAQHVSLTYSGAAARHTVYADGRVRTGDVVFRRLVDAIDVRATYRFTAAPPHDVGGTMALAGTITSPSGWTLPVPLGPAVSFTRDAATVHALIRFSRLDRAVARIGAATGLPATTYSLTVAARVRAHGTVAGHPTGALSASAPLGFEVDPFRVQPAASADGQPGGGGAAALDASTVVPGAVVVPATRTNDLGFDGHRASVGTVRAGGGTLTLLAAAMTLLGLWLRRGSRREADVIARTHRERLVTVTGGDSGAPRPVIDVTSIDALVRVAERYDRLVLHRPEGDVDSYLVDDDGLRYRYRTRSGSIVRGGRRRAARRSA